MVCNHMSWGNALVKAKTMSQIPLLHNFRRIFCMKQEIQQDQKNSKTVSSPTAVGALHTYTQTTRGLKQGVSWVMAPGRKNTKSTNYCRGFGSDSHVVGNNTVELNLGMRSTCIGVTRRLRRPPRCVQDTRNDYPF